MAFWNGPPTEGERTEYTEMQGSSRGMTTAYTYSDPASFGTQAFPNHENPFPEPFSQYDEYFHPWTPDAEAIQRERDLIPDFMQYPAPILPASGHSMDYHSQYQAVSLATNLGASYQVPRYETNIANEDTALWVAQNHPRRGKRKLSSDDTATDAKRLRSSNKTAPRSQPSAMKQKLPPKKKLAPAPSIQQPDLSDLPSASTTPATGKGGTMSKLGQKKAKLGSNLGTDSRKKAEVRMENGVLLGLVDNMWMPAGYHEDFREKLIMKAAQQPGAPVWRKEMSLNYTSYSPMIKDWTRDPRTVRDSKGRQVCLMRDPPADWQLKPNCGYLMCEGLVMLDHNNRPVRDYPGAPLTMSTETPPWVMQGLRRCLGMTVSDLRFRFPLKIKTRSGKWRPQLSNSGCTERVKRWMKDNGLEDYQWFDRKKGGESNTNRNLTTTPPLNIDENPSKNLSHASSSAPMPSVATTTSNESIQPEPETSFMEDDYWQHLSWDIDEPLPWPKFDPLPEANRNSDIPEVPFPDSQLSYEPSEQTRGDNQYNVLASREANAPAQSANNAAQENIYCPCYPFGFSSDNIYSPTYPFG